MTSPACFISWSMCSDIPISLTFLSNVSLSLYLPLRWTCRGSSDAFTCPCSLAAKGSNACECADEAPGRLLDEAERPYRFDTDEPAAKQLMLLTLLPPGRATRPTLTRPVAVICGADAALATEAPLPFVRFFDRLRPPMGKVVFLLRVSTLRPRALRMTRDGDGGKPSQSSSSSAADRPRRLPLGTATGPAACNASRLGCFAS